MKKSIPDKTNSKAAFVRECDETEKGQFVAYVDQNEQTYDVSLTLDDKDEPISHTCDCKSKAAFCEHKVALLQYLSTRIDEPSIGRDKTKSIPAALIFEKKKKKPNPTQILLDQIEPEKLKIWIRDQLAKNKELELNFTNQFAIFKQEYTAEIVSKLTVDAVKAVVKNRRKLDSNEVKKIVDFWETVHEPILNLFYTYVEDDDAFKNFQSIIDTCESIMFRIQTSSTRISKYLEKLVQRASESIKNQKDDVAWAKSLSYFAVNMYDERSEIRIPYMLLMIGLENQSNEARKKKYALILFQTYLKRKESNISWGTDNHFTMLVFNALERGSLLKEHISNFKPIRHEILFNEKLIQWLINNKQFELAEKYCHEQISSNSQIKSNAVYLGFLKMIYELKKDHKNLLVVLKELFPSSFKFEDYVEILKIIKNEGEKNEFRNRVLGLARALTVQGKREGIDFSFELMDYEKNYLKMIEYLNEHVHLSLISKYAEKMAQADKVGFTKKLLDISPYQEYYHGYGKEELNTFFSEMKSIIRVHFSFTELYNFLQTLSRRNSFVKSQTLTRLLIVD